MKFSHIIEDNNSDVLVPKNSDSNTMTVKDEVIFDFSIFARFKDV